MFDSFKSTFKRCKESKYNGREGNGYQPLPQLEEIKLPKEDRAYYTVGSLDDGRVQLTVGHPTSITLTMNEAAVRQMIKLLEAAITEKDQFE